MSPSNISVNFHTHGEPCEVNVSGNEYSSWATVKFGSSNVTFFVPDAWHLVSMADELLHAANQYMKSDLQPVELDSV